MELTLGIHVRIIVFIFKSVMVKQNYLKADDTEVFWEVLIDHGKAQDIRSGISAGKKRPQVRHIAIAVLKYSNKLNSRSIIEVGDDHDVA